MQRTLPLVLLLLSGCGLWPSLPRRPPIVLIVIDDLGVADLGSYGNQIHSTPNLDRLAREGLRFTRAYAASPVCAPTRAALLTGLSPARLHLTQALPALGRRIEARPAPERGPPERFLAEPVSANYLPAARRTLAEALSERGYRTAFIGKWHLGTGDAGPAAQGFDRVVGGSEEAGPDSHFDPYGLSLLEDRRPGEYLSDRLTDEAEAFLAGSGGEPFFLVLSHFALHRPLEAPEQRVRAWRRRLGRGATDQQAVYAAMLESVDESVGRVLEALAETGRAEETLVVVTSDNGGLTELSDAGLKVTSNGPQRGGKGSLYEGGLRVPLLVRWPAVVEAGTDSAALVSSQDLFPTLVRAAGGDLSRQSLDGVDVLGVLRGGQGREDRTLFFHLPHYIRGWRPDPAQETYWNTPAAAVRSEEWKLIRRFEGTSELYDLAADPSETRNLVAERPEVAARLQARLEAWLASVGAHLPRPNLEYDPEAFARQLERALASLGSAGEWSAHPACEQVVEDGVLRIDCPGHPFVVGPEMAVPGPVRIAFRSRVWDTKGGGSLWYRGAGKPRFSGDRVPFRPFPGGGWQTHEVLVDRTSTLRQLRIDFGRPGGGRAEVDWIKLYRASDPPGSPVVEWSFDEG